MIKCKQGFSLVEAIVALVVLSLVFTSIWGWFGTATKSTQRIEQAISLPEVFSQFIVYLELEPLGSKREGVFHIHDFDVYWQAQIEKRSDQESYRKQPAWIVSLFSVDVEIRQGTTIVSQLTTKTVRQNPDPNYIDFGAQN